MGEVERAHIEVSPKLWNLRPYDKMNGEITKSPHLVASYQKVKEEMKDWGDYRKMPEEIPEFPLIRRMLLGADSVVQTPRIRAFETNERRMAKITETMDPCFVGRNSAVLQYAQFVYTDDSTRRRMTKAATPKPGKFEEEWTKLDTAPTVMRGKADLRQATLIVMSVKPELAMSGKLLTRTALAPFGCEENKIKHGEDEDKSAGRLVVPNFPDEMRSEEQGPLSSEGIRSETIWREKTVDRKNPCSRIPIKREKTTIRLRQVECPA